MAVNISAMEFGSEKFLEGVFSVLEATGLEPQSLELELTESVLMKRAEVHGVDAAGLESARRDSWRWTTSAPATRA